MYKLKVERLPESRAVITGELSLETLAAARPKALKELNSRVKIPGFREGSVPEAILVKSLGEMRVLEETAEVAIGQVYTDILKDAEKDLRTPPIGRPQIAITKMAPGVPLEFKITVTLEPEFKLPDYHKIAKETPLPEIPKHEHKEGEVHDHEHNPELEKFWQREKHRVAIIEELINKTEVKVPELLVEYELNKMLARLEDDVRNHGLRFDDYLKSINKTEVDIKNEWHEKAERQAKAELIIGKIAESEKISPTMKELEDEIAHIVSHYPDADQLRVRIYAYQLLRNQKVLEFLETQAPVSEEKETPEPTQKGE